MGILEDEALEEHLRSYQEGFVDGYAKGTRDATGKWPPPGTRRRRTRSGGFETLIDITKKRPKKRKLSAWNKFVKANSKKPRFIYRNGKLNLKKMGVAFRKTPAGKKKR